MFWKSALLALAVLLGFCDPSQAQNTAAAPVSVATVFVPDVTVHLPAGTTPAPGQYAALVQSGGWKLHAKTRGLDCSLWEFDTSVNDSYQAAVRDVLNHVLGSVTFFDATLTGDQIQRMGLNALLTVTQSTAISKVHAKPGPADSTDGMAASMIMLTANLTIANQKGLFYQETIYGKGTAVGPVVTCEQIKSLTSQAAQRAIADIASDLALFIRAGL